MLYELPYMRFACLSSKPSIYQVKVVCTQVRGERARAPDLSAPVAGLSAPVAARRPVVVKSYHMRRARAFDCIAVLWQYYKHSINNEDSHTSQVHVLPTDLGHQLACLGRQTSGTTRDL